MTQIRKAGIGVIFICVIFGAAINADLVFAEFYKYVDKDGVLRFVDDPAKIPPQYRENIETYRETYDHLSENEKEKLREAEEAEQLTGENQAGEIKAPQKADTASDKPAVSEDPGTPVTIQGSQIIVPVTLGFNGSEIETQLLLDTGANIIALHQYVAERLNVVRTKSARAYVAGGQTVKFRLFKLSYIQVGPHRMEDVDAGIINHRGPPVSFDGLLGANFLQNYKYSIDYPNRMIRWSP